MNEQQELEYRAKWENIEKEFDAIEVGAAAVVHMLRKVKECAVELHKTANHPLAPDALETVTRLRDQDVEELHRVRMLLGHILEDVGNFIDGSDMADDRCSDIVTPAFSLMQSFPDNLDPLPSTRKWPDEPAAPESQGQEGGDHG